MGRIHGLSHPLRSHDEVRENEMESRIRGVLILRSFPVLAPAGRGVFLSRYRLSKTMGRSRFKSERDIISGVTDDG